MSMDHPHPRPPGEPTYRLAGVVAEVLNEGAIAFPISAEAASGQIEAALRLHQPPGRDILIMISGIALAAAATLEHGAAGVTQP
jgi:predicted nucleic acid-binding protein